MANIWAIEYANGESSATAGKTFPNDVDGTRTSAKWFQCIGSGTVVAVCEGGQVFTRHALGGEVYKGSFTSLTSTTCTYLVMGNGPPPPPAPSTTTSTNIVRTGASGAQTNATTTMANLADLTVNVSAGQKISGTMRIFANNSTGAEGIKFDFNGGSASFTSIEFGFVATPGGATVGTKTSTAIGTAITCSAVATTDSVFEIPFAGVVNAAGTLIPRFAENSTSSGTATVQINSTLSIATTAN